MFAFSLLPATVDATDVVSSDIANGSRVGPETLVVFIQWSVHWVFVVGCLGVADRPWSDLSVSYVDHGNKVMAFEVVVHRLYDVLSSLRCEKVLEFFLNVVTRLVVTFLCFISWS